MLPGIVFQSLGNLRQPLQPLCCDDDAQPVNRSSNGIPGASAVAWFGDARRLEVEQPETVATLDRLSTDGCCCLQGCVAIFASTHAPHELIRGL